MLGKHQKAQDTPSPPHWLLAELTYACPLQCIYCSNPLDFSQRKKELDTKCWIQLLRNARELGAVQLGLSGGEPLLRKDLTLIVSEAHALNYYTNLITSAVGLNENRLIELKNAGLDSIQISLQAPTERLNHHIARTKLFEHKLFMAKKAKEKRFKLTLNIVIHRLNIDSVGELLDLALDLKADYIELANTQYYGFAFVNRDRLLPTFEQIKKTEALVGDYQKRYRDKAKIYYVIPDYYRNRPKPCMNGWGKIFLTITPDGYALPCHSARIIPNLIFPTIHEHSLHWIWYESPLFNTFRGHQWMKEPCRSCSLRFKDFGGCRCQAYLLLNDAYATDPVCDLSPKHGVIQEAIDRAMENTCKEIPLIYRNTRTSKSFLK
ncbi:pyrroloquinoline quinone biosynthesis protein PqqE [Rickettsiella grylli]|uniref:PqqA peptide cyclase n=1 Tax=Rickettsiella grylli TaxID=59196 RepID=A8PLU2_9COXI|nr:pyrroloquinoline quinone biosynthesis protein PqqE [Rickettsiella grylli]EDP47035.1 coenzyme PQQ biosynthesis protein E [Rickettsiella grylli]